jgi:Fic family protein
METVFAHGDLLLHSNKDERHRRQYRTHTNHVSAFDADGNGRISRVLTTLLLLRARYNYVPYCSLESIIEQTKDAYYLALRKAQGTIRNDAPEWSAWVVYFLKALQQQKQRLESKIERERIVIGFLPELSVTILELAKNHVPLSIRQIVGLTGANRNTVKKHLQTPVSDNHLKQHGKRKGTWYGRT